jgi:hypothetical protein
MIQLSHDPRFIEEHSLKLLIVAQVVSHQLECNQPIERVFTGHPYFGLAADSQPARGHILS